MFGFNILKGFVVSIFILFAFTACASDVLQKESVSNLDVTMRKVEGDGFDREIVSILGMPMHSALIISEYQIKDKGDHIDIQAKLELCGSLNSSTGMPFYLEIAINPQTKYITLAGSVIWKRSP